MYTDGRCVRLTTYRHYSAVVTKTRSLNSPGILRAYMACWGRLYCMYTDVSVQDILSNFNHHLISNAMYTYSPPRLEYYVLLVVVSRDGK